MIITINEFRKTLVNNNVIRESVDAAAIAVLQGKIDTIKDLWEMDKLADAVEADDTVRGETYNNFHREIIPAWVGKHWSKDMTYKGENLNTILYNKFQPVFAEYLLKQGFDSQECFVSYAPGAMLSDYDGEPKYYDSDSGIFKMGFDIFKDDENSENTSGWACFGFRYNDSNFNSNNPIKQVPTEDTHRMDLSPEYDVIDVMLETGKGMFYKYVTKPPYKGLADVFGDGGYVLRLD